MSWAMSVMRRAIVPLDSGTDSRSRANLSTAAGLINVLPIVCGFFACSIKYATSYEALWASTGIVCLWCKMMSLMPLFAFWATFSTIWTNSTWSCRDKTAAELVEKLHAFQRKLSLFSVDLCPGKIPLGLLDRIPCTFKLLQFYSVPCNALCWWRYIWFCMSLKSVYS